MKGICYYHRDEIDTAKWNACIQNAANGLIYSYTYYLDCMCKQWDGLVFGDYEAVMPLPWRKKWGIYYLYQPYLAAQSGVTGNNISAAMVLAFLDAIPKKFRYWDLPLNHGNVFPLPHYRLILRSNYVLQLEQGYEAIVKNYRTNTRRNCIKADARQCTVNKYLPVRSAIALAELYTPVSKGQTMPTARFEQLYQVLQSQGRAAAYGVMNAEETLVSAAVFLWSNGRVYYILAANTKKGKELGSSYQLIDTFIQHHAGQHLLLDFEGSDLAGLAYFYSGFGPCEEKYSALQVNRLPFYARWLKE